MREQTPNHLLFDCPQTHPDIYRRAVLRWPNDTSEQIAVVHGSPEYQAAMTIILQEYHSRTNQDTIQHPLIPSRQTLHHYAHITDQAALSLELMKPFRTMSQTLKDQIEPLLPGPLAILGVAFPIFFQPQHQQILSRAIHDAGLRPALSYFQTSSPLAVAAAYAINLCKCPMWGRGCAESFPWNPLTLLSVEFTGGILTIFLYESNNPSWHSDRGLLHVTTDSLSNITIDTITTQTQDETPSQRKFWKEITHVIQTLHARKNQKPITHLLLSGTRANDTNLHRAIQKALGVHLSKPFLPFNTAAMGVGDDKKKEPKYWTFEVNEFKLYRTRMADPVVAAGQGAADLSWRLTMKGCLDPCSQWRSLPQCPVLEIEKDSEELDGQADPFPGLWEMFPPDGTV